MGFYKTTGWAAGNEITFRAIVSAVLLTCALSSSVQGETCADRTALSEGGWNPEQWLAYAQLFADTLLDTALDRYGPEHTPLWVGIVDPDTGAMVTERPPNWLSYYDAEDYMMYAQGCNPYRDLPALRGFYTLSDMTGDDRYREAADAYLRFFLRVCPSKTTGLFPWGEHLSYNCVRERITAIRHELEYNLPDWEMLWRINPEAVRREIEAIHRIHIYDKEEGYFDRHGHYYTGQFDPMPVRGSYIKHSGLYAYSFMFLYSKTGDREHLEWARMMADLYWSKRDPATGLVPGYVAPNTRDPQTRTQLLLAYYLLKSLDFYPDPFVKTRALAMVDTHLKYGFDRETGWIEPWLDGTTGETIELPMPGGVWSSAECGYYFQPRAIWKAYALTGEQRYLDALEAACRHAANQPFYEEMQPSVAGAWIDLFVKTYAETHKKEFLSYARRLAAWSAEHFMKRGLIIESASGYVYQTSSRPGGLMEGWLALYEAERSFPIHWLAPDAVRPGDGGFAFFGTRSGSTRKRGEIRLTWEFQDGLRGHYEAGSKGGVYLFPVPDGTAQGPLAVEFKDVASGELLDTGTILVTASPDGARIDALRHPKWVDRTLPIEGTVAVSDAAGVMEVLCRYTYPDGREGEVACEPLTDEQDRYRFVIPAAGPDVSGDITFRLVAQSNPAWPVTTESPERRVVLSSTATLQSDDGPACTIERVPVNPYESAEGLPGKVLSDFYVVAVESGGSVPDTFAIPIDPAAILPVLRSTLAAYTWNGARWEPASGASFEVDEDAVSITLGSGGAFVVAAEPRARWRRPFNGALLCSPAAIRIDKQGTLAIVTDTKYPDGQLYALTADGDLLWTVDRDETQPWVAVADLDGDGLDEIALGGRNLALVDCAGKVLWEADLPEATVPAIGDVDGDGDLDIVAATHCGEVAAYSAAGRELWRTEVSDWLEFPALGDVNGDGALDVVVGGYDVFFAISGRDGTVLWRSPMPGKSKYAPAIADIDGDGKCEVVNYSQTDPQGNLCLFDDDGTRLWLVAVQQMTDWSPIIADFDGTGEPRIVAQLTNVHKLGILNVQGEIVRTIDVPGRIEQTPVPVDLDGDGKLDLLSDYDLIRQMRAYGNDGTLLWTYTATSQRTAGARMKNAGSLLVADIDGDGFLDVVGGDDLTFLNAVRTDTPCAPFQIVSGQYHGDPQHSGNYMKGR